MRKLFLFLAFVFTSFSSVQAFDLPVDKNGIPARWVQDVGVRVYFTTMSIAGLVTGSSNTTTTSSVLGSSIAIYGVLTSSHPGGIASNFGSPGYVELRATNTANSTSELIVPPIKIGVFLSTAGVTPFTTTEIPANNFVQFDPPVIAMDNLSVNLSSAVGTCTSCKFEAAVFYRYLSTNLPEDVWFPQDDSQGVAPLSASMYGVKSGTTAAPAGGLANDRQGTETLDQTTGNLFIYTSTIPENQAPLFLYGWSVSSGTLSNSFRINDATGTLSYPNVPNFFPPILPHTLGRIQVSAEDFCQWNFPWPVIVQKAIWFAASSNADRIRIYNRSRRALR